MIEPVLSSLPASGDQQHDGARDEHAADDGRNAFTSRGRDADGDRAGIDAMPLPPRDRYEERGDAEDEEDQAKDEECAHADIVSLHRGNIARSHA